MGEEQNLKHRGFPEIIASMLDRNWGYQTASVDEAEKKVFANKQVTEYALLEILRRLSNAVKALGPFPTPDEDEDEDVSPVPPDYAKAIPGIAVGDVLYYCNDLDDGVERCVVVQVFPGGYSRYVDLTDDPEADPCRRKYVAWTGDNSYRTAAEALKAQAESDIAYHAPRLAVARKVKAACDRGDDLTPFLHGVDIDEEGDESDD